MPLHADDESLRRVFDPFERAVGRPRRFDETVAEATERLMMVRGDAHGCTDDLAELRAFLDLDRMHREFAGHLLVDVVPDFLGQVLDEVSTTRDVQELEPA